MRSRNQYGGSTFEFAAMLMLLVPLVLGTGVVGINLILTLQTIQLARDAGHMYARGLDFSEPGNQTILQNVGGNVGLNTAGGGSAVVILSAITYVDKSTCATAGAVDASGNPSGCTNYGKWVFTQRLVIGNSAVRSSNYGSPLTSGPTGVTVDSTNGTISLQDYVTKAGAVATFSSINPYSSVDGVVSGLPSGQFIYVAEAAANGFSMPPFVPNAKTYSYGMF
ncbi:MAG TPA: hypothetical protein VG675_14170 [Bryobacteraceae bacterium]|nr:hypothetical protein [Bryobacteraceae bacterium]